MLTYTTVISLYGFINANENRTRCCGSYCFTTLNEGVTHSSISICAPSYVNLEIYDDQMMKDVVRFSKEIDAITNAITSS